MFLVVVSFVHHTYTLNYGDPMVLKVILITAKVSFNGILHVP